MERYRTTIILGGVLLVLGILAFFLSSRNAASPGTVTPVPNVYVWDELVPVKALEAVSGSEKIVLTKDPVLGSWRINEPVDELADIFQVGSVADSMQRLQAQYALSDTTDLEQFGLASPVLEITATFSDTAGSTRKLLVGKLTPDGAGYYVKTPDSNKLYTVLSTTIGQVVNWLKNPPVQPPTPTPVPITPVTATPTEIISATATLSTPPPVTTPPSAETPVATNTATP